MKLIRYILTLLLPFFGLIAPLYGQMVSGGDTLYGNEWISYDQEYLKIRVADDGIYRITAEQLIDAGAPLSQIDASDFRLYWLGKERMIHCSKEEGTLTSGDYLEFFGSKNRSQVDRFLFSDPDNQMLNPEYGLTTDTSTYYLTWSNVGNGLRFEAISNVLDGPLPPKKTWYLHQEKIILNQQHFKPYLNTDNVRYSTYAQAEGFSSREASSHNFTIPTKDASSSGPNPSLHLKMTGSSPATQVSLKWNNQEFVDLLIQGNNFTGGAELVDTIIPLSLGLSDENTFIATTSDDSDEIRFGVISLSFPRMFKFDLQSSILIQVEEAREGIYLELEDFNHGGMPPIVYDLSAGTVSNGAIADGFIKINLPSGPNSRSLAIVHPDHVLPTQTISAVDFIDLSSSDAEFLIISNQKLYDDGQGKNWVEEYANYRRSDIGGNYRTQILEIQQLIDQFTYGVDMHPLSIKNFTNYAHKNWSSAKYLFLIGKGLEYAEARLFDGSLNYLPVYGIPGSDNLLTSRTESSMPLIPVGRLAARAPAQVQLYLDKIKVMEDQITNAPQTIADRGWMKRVLHLGGGVGQSEIGVLRDRLNEMGEILEENEIQSDVFSWSIQSQDVIDFNNDETVIDLINDGLIIKTYFGHGSIFTTQFNGFEDPQFLDNKDRYSVMLSLGCYTGNLFTSENSLGEANIFSEDRGAIIYMATSGLGFLSALDVFGKNWYSLVGGEFLNHGIGEINQRVLSDFDAVGTVGIKTLMQQLILHGDPAFRLSRLDGPDYTIDFESVSFDPPIINSIQDSFSIAFDFYNLGSKQNDSIQIDFFHELPSKNKVLLSSQKIKSTTFKQAINFVLPLLNGFDLRGINTLLVELNPDRSIDEFPEGSAYNNNSLMGSTGTIGIKIPIVNNGVSPVFPPNYSIWSEEKLELISSTADPLAVDQSYIIQIDTTMHFNSSVLQETTINQRGGLIKWSPAIVLDPMRVYYWRVSPDSSSQQTYLWSGSSFTYIPESPDGWCQSHYFQFLDGQSDGLVLNVDRRFSYQQNYNEIRILNARARGEQVTQFFYDGRQFSSPLRSTLKAGISMIVVNPVDQSWYVNEGAAHGSILVSNAANLFSYDVSNPEARRDLGKFVDEIVPDGHYVFLYTHLKDTVSSFNAEEWAADSLIYGTNLFSVLERHGARLVRNLKDYGTVPYNFFFQKNGPVLAEDIATSKFESILSTGQAYYLNPDGKYTSTIIGPASEWVDLKWQFDYSENPGDDQFEMAIFGLQSPQDIPQLLVEKVPNDGQDLSQFTTSRYPYLKLELQSKDEVNRSTPQLKNWKVHFDGLPDIAINPVEEYQFEGDTLLIGDELTLIYSVENVSNYDMDSVLVAYTIINAQNSSQVTTERYGALPAKGQDTYSIEFPTTAFLPGNHLLLININPAQDQPESFIGNNVLLQKFFIEGDRINPILSATFDGVHIMNGDIVSPTPIIQISLKDENKSILIQDSSLFEVKFKYPDSSTKILEPDGTNLIFTPASDERNLATLEIQENFPIDGIHELIVQGKDVSGNPTAKNALHLEFNVVNATSAAHVVPFPNPFSTSTKFLYTLTGSIPTLFKIQIMTVDGSVVKEINLTHEENLKIGTHLTEFIWDGTDMFNDKLANGIYLYRVTIKNERGESTDLFQTSVDSHFDKNLGKIVILR